MSKGRALLYRIPLFVLASLGLLYLIVHTPLRQYLPGYLDSSKRAALEGYSMRIDSLEAAGRVRMVYLENMIAVLANRQIEHELVPFDSVASVLQDTLLLASERERNFSARYEEQERFGLSKEQESEQTVFFITPVKGEVLNYDEEDNTVLGTDVRVLRESPVVAPLEGTVVSVSLIAGQGYRVVMQHPNDFVSVMSNLNKVLVEEGQMIKAGHVLGHVGGKAKSSSSVLNIQIWHKGNALESRSIMMFE